MEYETNNELIEEEAGETTTPNYLYAGFWMRLWAFLLDGIVIFSLNGILAYPLLRALQLMDDKIWIISISGLLTAVVGFVYFSLMTKFFSQTLGKQVFGLKVIRTDGQPLTWENVLFREVVGRYLHYPFWFLNFLYLIVAFSNKKQGLHDKVADTFVIHEGR